MLNDIKGYSVNVPIKIAKVEQKNFAIYVIYCYHKLLIYGNGVIVIAVADWHNHPYNFHYLYY